MATKNQKRLQPLLPATVTVSRVYPLPGRNARFAWKSSYSVENPLPEYLEGRGYRTGVPHGFFTKSEVESFCRKYGLTPKYMEED